MPVNGCMVFSFPVGGYHATRKRSMLDGSLSWFAGMKISLGWGAVFCIEIPADLEKVINDRAHCT
jgi:hypothetical protein